MSTSATAAPSVPFHTTPLAPRADRLVLLALAIIGLIAVHHVLFDRLQAGGAGVYCLASAMRSALLRLNTALLSVGQTAQGIAAASGEVAHGSTDLSRRTEQAADSLKDQADQLTRVIGAFRLSGTVA